MSLSRPIQSALISYLTNLYTNPIRTKALTSCAIFTSANLVSQCMQKSMDHQNLMAHAVFGLLFGGTIPHYYYKILEYLVPNQASLQVIKKLLLDRLLYTPVYLTFYLYVINRLQGKTHDQAMKHLSQLLPVALVKNWTYLTVFQLVNLTMVPPMMRVLTSNLAGFAAIVYVAYLNKQREAKEGSKK